MLHFNTSNEEIDHGREIDKSISEPKSLIIVSLIQSEYWTSFQRYGSPWASIRLIFDVNYTQRWGRGERRNEGSVLHIWGLVEGEGLKTLHNSFIMLVAYLRWPLGEAIDASAGERALRYQCRRSCRCYRNVTPLCPGLQIEQHAAMLHRAHLNLYALPLFPVSTQKFFL